MAAATTGNRVEALERECAALRKRVTLLSAGLAVAVLLGSWGAYGAMDAAATRANRSPVFDKIGLRSGDLPVYVGYEKGGGIVVSDALGSRFGRIIVEPSQP